MIRTVEHVQKREGEYYVSHTHVPVGVVVASWKHGTSPEHIVNQFPALSLADVFGVVTYYLDHQKELEKHFAALQSAYERERLRSRAERPDFYADLQQRIDLWRSRNPTSDSELKAQSEEPLA